MICVHTHGVRELQSVRREQHAIWFYPRSRLVIFEDVLYEADRQACHLLKTTPDDVIDIWRASVWRPREDRIVLNVGKIHQGELTPWTVRDKRACMPVSSWPLLYYHEYFWSTVSPINRRIIRGQRAIRDVLKQRRRRHHRELFMVFLLSRHAKALHRDFLQAIFNALIL